MSETVIVAALRQGNIKQAVELILDTYEDDLFAYCAGRVGLEEATAVYQRVVADALEQLSTFTGGVSVRAWLYGVARSAVLHHRDRSRRPPRSSAARMTGAGEEGDPVRPKDPELRGCLEALEPATREILELLLWHHLTPGEVAHVSGRSTAEVRHLAAHGLGSLAGELQRAAGTPS